MNIVFRWSVSVLCALACILYVPADPESDLVAGGPYDLGRMVEQTPFDSDLARAGFFRDDPALSRLASSSQTVERLFRKARSFRYTSDKIRRKHWQTAKETDIKHSGNCIDKALWLYTELKKNGYRHVRLVIGRYRSIDPTLHAWLIYANGSGETYLLDSAMQNKPWKLTQFSKGLYRPFYSFDGKNRYAEFNRF